MKPGISLALLLALGAPSVATAGRPVEKEVKCPIGGRQFTYTTTSSYQIFGYRPDGRPWGTWRFPIELPICPDNGLVMYKDFSPAEIERLPPILASQEFRALADETPHYRAAWLTRRLDPSDKQLPWMLMMATWETDSVPASRRKYLEEFVDAARNSKARTNESQGYTLAMRQANALRELGRFDEGNEILKKLGPPPPPSDNNIQFTADQITASKAFHAKFVHDLGIAIANKDTSIEPLNVIPRDLAVGYCAGWRSLPPRQDPFCETNEIKAEMVKFQERMSTMEKEMRERSSAIGEKDKQ